jgi:choline-glycine betaine transporter
VASIYRRGETWWLKYSAGGICLVAALTYNCLVGAMGHCWGITPTEIMTVAVLMACAIGFAVSGVRGSRPWARGVSAAVLMIAVFHVVVPMATLSLFEVFVDFVGGFF